MKIISTFESRGNIELLSQKTIAVFGSRSTPKEIYPQAEAVFKKLLAQPVSIAGGWQAPVEKHLLKFCSLHIQANLILYSAKDISEIKLTTDLQQLEKEQKLLIVSSQSRQKRASQSDVKKRDELLFSQIKQVLFLYIEPGGRLENYYNSLQQKQYPVFILENELNRRYINDGCPALHDDNMEILLQAFHK